MRTGLSLHDALQHLPKSSLDPRTCQRGRTERGVLVLRPGDLHEADRPDDVAGPQGKTPAMTRPRIIPSALAAVLALPRPSAAHFELQRKAQECPDKNDNDEDSNALKRRRCRHGSDDITGNEKLKAQENGTAKCLAELPVIVGQRWTKRLTLEEDNSRESCADDNRRHADRIDSLT